MSINSDSDHEETPPPFIDPSQQPSSPFHIHPSESRTSIIVTPPLTGNNYQSWSRSIRMALISKNKMGRLELTLYLLIGSVAIRLLCLGWFTLFLPLSPRASFSSKMLLPFGLIFAKSSLKAICCVLLSYKKRFTLSSKVLLLSPTTTLLSNLCGRN